MYNLRSVLCSFAISTKFEELDVPSLSKLLTCILSEVKTGRFQSYCYTSYSGGVVTQILILKNSNDMYIQSMSISSCNSIKTFDLSTLYTTIPY